MAIGKAVASVASILLVVGVAIGVVTFVKKDQGGLNAHQKAVQSICQSTTDKGSCEKTLEPVQSDDPKKLIKAFLLATKDAISKSSDFTASTEGKMGPNINATNKAVLDYCKKVLSYALEDLETIVEEMGEDLEKSGPKLDQLKQWLTGVFNYQSDCLDDIEDEELKKIMDEGIANSKILSSNALDIFDSVVSAMSQMGVKVDDMKINESIPPRHLLENLDEEGLPNWHSGADRKLMAQAGRDDGIGEGGGGGGNIKPSHVVAKDGSGQFKTIGAAVNACPEKNPGRCIIYIKAGVYNEVVSIPKKKNNVFMFGDGATQTIITFNKSVKLTPGTTTSLSATVQVESEGFMMKWIGVKNTAGPLGHQAVALRVNGDRTVVFNCRFEAFQDTLYVNNGRQFYRNILVSGTVDFIFGRSATVIQNSLIVVRKGTQGQSNYVTADGNEKGRSVKIGIVLHNCRIVADKDLEAEKLTTKSYLGRPWKKFSTTAFIGCEIGDMIQPVGWTEWQGNDNHKTCTYIEFNNRGPGADTSQRLRFVKVDKTAAEVQIYSVASWVGPANWIQEANVPVQLGL